MAREKVTITADRGKLAAVRAATGAHSTSEAVDLALDALLRAARVRQDVEAYRASPQTSDEASLVAAPRPWTDLADDTDWDAIYGAESS